MKRLWKIWKIISHKMAYVEATVILTIFYFILIGPFALIFKKRLEKIMFQQKQKSFWHEKKSHNVKDLESLKKQY